MTRCSERLGESAPGAGISRTSFISPLPEVARRGQCQLKRVARFYSRGERNCRDNSVRIPLEAFGRIRQGSRPYAGFKVPPRPTYERLPDQGGLITGARTQGSVERY